MGWRLARSLGQLREEANLLAPLRSKASDGTKGDPAHAARKSDHNPDEHGVVRAFDLTHDPAHGMDAHAQADRIRRGRKAGKYRSLTLVISNRRYASARTGWDWATYTGPNAHDKHAHFSAADAATYDDTTTWGMSPPEGSTPPPAPPPEVPMIFVYAGAATPDALGAASEAFHNGLAGTVLTHDPVIARAALKVPAHRVVAVGGPSVREIFGDTNAEIGVRVVDGRHLVIVGASREETTRFAVEVARAGWRDVV